MLNQRLQVQGKIHEAKWLLRTHAGQQLLANAYSAPVRPRCMCMPTGVEMVVAKRGSRYYLARMPGSGPLHAATCPCIEASDNYLSGVDCYRPGVIDQEPDGSLSVRFDPATPRGRDLPSVGIEGLLDLLIDEAGLNVYDPAAAPMRWQAANKALHRAAQLIRMGDTLLADRMLVAEPFDKDNRDAQHGRQLDFLGAEPGRLVVAPLREIAKTEYGWKVTLKHLPAIRFWLPKQVGQDLYARCGGLVALDAPPPALCCVVTKPARQESSFGIAAIAIRRVDDALIPCNSATEADIAGALAGDGRRFIRPLRFDSAWDRVLADYAFSHDGRDCLGFAFLPSGNDILDEAKRRTAMPLIRGRSSEFIDLATI